MGLVGFRTTLRLLFRAVPCLNLEKGQMHAQQSTALLEHRREAEQNGCGVRALLSARWVEIGIKTSGKRVPATKWPLSP